MEYKVNYPKGDCDSCEKTPVLATDAMPMDDDMDEQKVGDHNEYA